ncbi:hypothetical protein CCM_02436 [Cordyceps militaris CM01]|uniref:Uncharacterized protein n=1 Tax=Cordyceps militaris (strain CM01) TaxID=983644 RepID=G3J9N9_CORMM|nr:uncharacterized protein CCM_02436 [Cordyceps militaris CM01]EGX94165.1 hypothetical protein CCM_02436 [Cordyceps militaris CM01]
MSSQFASLARDFPGVSNWAKEVRISFRRAAWACSRHLYQLPYRDSSPCPKLDPPTSRHTQSAYRGIISPRSDEKTDGRGVKGGFKVREMGIGRLKMQDNGGSRMNRGQHALPTRA